MKYAYFDPNTFAVRQLLDTDAFSYSSLPPSACLLELTDEQYSAASSSDWYIVAGVLTETPPETTLIVAQAQQLAAVNDAYQAAVAAPISFTSAAGVTKMFQSDSSSQTMLMQATQGYGLAGSTPTGFYWVSADNTQVPFTLADLSGLYRAVLAQGWVAFQKKQLLKTEISTATTVASVQSVVWQ